MTKLTASYTYKPPPPVEVEVDAKAARCEAVRAVRVILGRPKSAETALSDTSVLPRAPSEPSRRGRST